MGIGIVVGTSISDVVVTICFVVVLCIVVVVASVVVFVVVVVVVVFVVVVAVVVVFVVVAVVGDRLLLSSILSPGWSYPDPSVSSCSSSASGSSGGIV